MNHILLLEDDRSLVDGLEFSLKKNGYACTVARTVGEAKALLAQRRYDLLLLDVSLPDGTGFSLCEWVRGHQDPVPILFLTAADEEVSIVRGLDCGGDDYVTKPFLMGELFSRIRALLRRAGADGAASDLELRCGSLQIDLSQSRVLLRGAPLELTRNEYKLLCLLVHNAGRIVTRQNILDALWDQNGNFVDENTVSVYIRRLREKLEADPSRPVQLLTVRGFGYRWNEVAE